MEHVDSEGLTPAALVITHGHSDHIGGNATLKRRWPSVPLVIGRGDAPKLTDAELNLSAAYGIALVSPPADLLLDEGEIYRAAGFELEVLEIPGHSSGHVVFVWRGVQTVGCFCRRRVVSRQRRPDRFSGRQFREPGRRNSPQTLYAARRHGDSARSWRSDDHGRREAPTIPSWAGRPAGEDSDGESAAPR